MYLPRRAVSHVLEAPITHPQDATRILAIDRASEEIHRTSMPDNVLAFSVRQWVRREIPAGRGLDAVISALKTSCRAGGKLEMEINALTTF